MEITREDIKRFMEKHNYHTQKVVEIPKEQLANFTKKELVCLVALNTMRVRPVDGAISNANCWAESTKQTILKEFFKIGV